jgi:pimeloyl-ACP methyl ester carboxylesterase
MPLTKVGNTRINYYTVGSGKPLVFISGLGADNNCWLYQIPDFKEYFKIIVFDNRGIGKSKGSFGQYSIKMMADDAIGLLKNLDIERAHIIGSSMGGMIAQELAINYPNYVDKLVLCSTFAKPQNMMEIIKKGLHEILGHHVDDIFEIPHHNIVFEKFFNFFLQQVFSENYLINNKHIIEELLQKNLSKITFMETFLKQVRAIRKHDSVDRLDCIKAETLVITGTEDKLVSPECSDIIADRIQNSKLIKVKQAEHGWHFEKPDVFKKIILDFLS